MEPGNELGCKPNSRHVVMYALLAVCCFQRRNCKQHIKSWIESRISVLASGLSVKQFDTHCTPNENIVMETGGREALVIGRSKVNLKKMLNVLPV